MYRPILIRARREHTTKEPNKRLMRQKPGKTTKNRHPALTKIEFQVSSTHSLGKLHASWGEADALRMNNESAVAAVVLCCRALTAGRCCACCGVIVPCPSFI